MTDANEMLYSNMLELNDLFSCVTDETEEEKDSFVLYEELSDADCIPPSLLSYFETSKNRAAVCEKLLLEESADFTVSHHNEDMLNLHFELNEDMIEENRQVICEMKNEEDNSSIDTRLLSASTETEALFTHSVSVSVCLNDEGEGGTNNCMESTEHLTFEMKTLEVSLNDEERKKSVELEAERQHCEEVKREERKRQIERDFQKELRKIIEAEKLHQKELELIERRAQEKLEQEFRLQQELIRNLQKQVEEERKMREEEQKKMKEEEEQRKREEEKNKMEAKKKREEAKLKREKEEERRAEEVKFEEEKKRRIEEEKKRKKEEERNKKDMEQKELEDEMRMMKEEEERKRKEEKNRTKREEEKKVKREMERKNIEGAIKGNKKEKRINEEEMSYKKEEEDRKEMKEEYMRTDDIGEVTKEVEERKMQEEMKKKEEEVDERKKVTQEKIDKEMRKRDKRAHGSVVEEIKLEESKKREERKRKNREVEEQREEASNREKERKNMEEQVKEVIRKPEEEITKTEEELRPIEDNERRKREDGRNTKEEEQRRRQKEEMKRQKNEEEYRKSKEERQEVEKRKSEEESKNVEAEKEQNVKKVQETNTEVNKKAAEEMKVTVKEESEIRIAQNREMEVMVVGANEVQDEKEVRENSMLGQKEKNKTDKPENPSQHKECTPWISSSSVPSHSESAIFPRTEAAPLYYDPDKNISQTSTDKTTDCENQPFTEFLPEHTEQKRLSWMKNCISWSKLSLQNKRKQKGSARSRGMPRRSAETNSLPPLCPDSLLQAAACRSLQEVTTVTLEDLPGCSLSTLAQCARLQSLSLRRCGLRFLEGINQLSQLCFIDVQENDISFVNCENMTSLRVLRLGHNKLTSIHGLTGAENLDVLDLSHNSITRIAGLESVKRLQRLSVAHNQLISTKGLRDVYTLLHLNCSHNHLASVEGLENSALLNTLDLRANSLTEPPSLNNQVLLRELHLDDNSISSLQSLTACWLPLMQHLSVAQNRITQLPSMSDFVSLENLDLRFNCMSEIQNLCKSLEGCQSLGELHLTGNPLQQESGWRSSLQRAVPGLRAIDNQETDSSLPPPAVQPVSLASGSFPAFCWAQLQQIHDLQQQHSRELSEVSSSLDAVKTSCRHFIEALQLAEEQRFAHEYGDTTVADKRITSDQTIPEETLETESTNAERHTEFPETESSGRVSPVLLKRDNIRCNDWISEEKSAGENRPDTFDTVTADPKTGPTVSKSSVHSLETKRKTFSSGLEMAPVSNHQNLDLQNTAAAAVVIQQLWRKYRQRCGKISSPSTAERGGGGGGGGGGGDGGKPESGPSYINGSVVGQAYAATVIQAFWRGFALRKRLASALAAVTCSDTGEDDTFEEVDVDGFVLDEAALEKHWIVPLPEDLPSRRNSVLEQPQSVKPPGPFPEPPQYLLQPPPAWRSKQAWVAESQVDSSGQKVSPVSLNRSKYPASVVGGLSERSEEILEEWGFTNRRTAFLMLRRAQNMKSKKQQQCRRREPSVRLAAIRNCSYQLGSVEAEKRQAHNYRKDRKVGEAKLRLREAEKTERVKQEGAQQWLQTRAAHSDRDSESGHFLPEINSGVLNGGRVQLVADSGYTERLHHASGLWANSRSAAQLCRENNYPHRNSLGHARDDVPPPKRVTSAPSKKERISFRDNPVQLSGGWGGGKKRDKVFK